MNPKLFLKQVEARWLKRLKPGYAEVLEHAPLEFKRAFQERKFAGWTPPGAGTAMPFFDDRSETWQAARYTFCVYTIAGQLFRMVVRVMAGRRDIVAEAEVGTAGDAGILRDYGPEGQREEERHYWEWVLANQEDPLGYVRLPRKEVRQPWLAAFVRDGNRLRLYGLRKLSKEEPAPPAVLWPDVVQKASADPEWKDALDFCSVTDQGFVSVLADDDLDQRWDDKGRLLVRFETVREEEPEEAAVLIQQARQHLGEGAARNFLKCLKLVREIEDGVPLVWYR